MRTFKAILSAILITVGVVVNAQDQSASTNNNDGKSFIINHYTKAYLLAMKYGDYNQAINAVYNVLAEYPNNDSLMYSLSYLYYQADNVPSAVLSAQEIIKQFPKHLGALEIVGNGYEQLGLKGKSLDAFESIYLQTNDYQTLYKVAFLQYELKRFKECNTNLDILLSKPEANTAKVYFNTEQDQQKEYPIKVSLLNLKGLISKANGDKANAKKFFEQALEIAPDFLLGKNNLKSLEE